MQNQANIATGDQRTKQAVVGALITIAVACVMTICYLALRAMQVPEELDRLATFVVGNLSGALIQTGVSNAQQSQRRADIGPTGTQADPISIESVEGGAVVVEEK